MVPRSRVDDVLQLMRRPAGTRLDPELARELAQRDGGIPTYITGRLSEVGNSTVLSASVIDVRSGATLAALTEKAADLTATPDATRRLSRQLRAALGETVAQSQSSGGLERVTTPSLKALRLYTDAYAAGAHNEWSAALTFASAAVDADPSFAAAHAWLAWAMYRNRLPREEYLAAALKAVSLAKNAAEWEQLWITGTYHTLMGDDARAQPLYEALLKLNPEHLWATNNLVGLHRRAGRDADALGPAMRLLELQPHDYNTLYIVLDLHRRLARLDDAVEYARRIQNAPGYNANPSGDAWVVEPFLAWSHGDAGAQLNALRALRKDAVTYRHELRDAVLTRAAALFVAAGRTSDASETLALSPPSTQRQAAEVVVALADERSADASRMALAAGAAELPMAWSNPDRGRLWSLAVWVAARHAPAGAAQHLFTSIDERMRQRDPAWREIAAPLLEAELAFAAGRDQQVIQLLAARTNRALSDEGEFRSAETLAEAQIRQRDVASAAKTLEQISSMKHLAAYDASYWWMRCQLRLAEVYLLLDRKEEALRVARELETMLRLADTDFPMTRRVQAAINAAGR